MRFAGIKRRLRTQERRRASAKDSARVYEPVRHDPRKPGAWRKLLATLRNIRKRGNLALVRRVVTHEDVQRERARHRGPSDPPMPQQPPSVPEPEPLADVAPTPDAPSAPEPAPTPKPDRYAHFEQWTMAQLDAHLATCMPMAERIAAETVWNAKNRARREAPNLTEEQARAAWHRHGTLDGSGREH